ncbi:DUF1801 domain-containing protein [Winogradskyella alexanderae]|uniref:DUF1801 domain-containing protein n=1 Tax=Winogradskyella alexanderae TaxID=2877123 RepID=A0ABS7XSW5_9FLAO|nr:DUF1801 domain-containing protein [Winogradskyella alexanderae]MCA0132870.1 DUF1801 domain-containing protein [Winogradskyella alexanderae]
MNPAEAYILKQEEPYKSILMQLQTIVEAILPNPELHYKWRIPFYYNGELPICYFNKSKDYVDLAFWHGERLTKHREHFITANRKAVTSLRYRLPDDINDDVILYVIKKQLAINTNPFKLVLKPKRSKRN